MTALATSPARPTPDPVAPTSPAASTSPTATTPPAATSKQAKREARSLTPLKVAAVVGIVFAGAIFGFFYAWVCSTMWGLDAIDPQVAIQAMNGMNASVRNFVFLPAFFFTTPVLIVVAFMARSRGRRATALFFAAAAALYLFGAMIPTELVNVPMNQELMNNPVPTDPATAAAVWEAYSSRWQAWNITRTVFSGLALIAAAIGTLKISRGSTQVAA